MGKRFDFHQDDKPEYEHDCNRCQFIGNFYYPFGLSPRHVGDAYYCPPPSDGKKKQYGSLLMRYGNEDSEYWSSILSIAVRCMFDGHFAHEFIRPVIREGLKKKIISNRELLNALKSEIGR